MLLFEGGNLGHLGGTPWGGNSRCTDRVSAPCSAAPSEGVNVCGAVNVLWRYGVTAPGAILAGLRLRDFPKLFPIDQTGV